MNENIKPIILIIEDTKKAIADIINQSNLPAYLVEPIIRGFYEEIRQLKNEEIQASRQDYLEKLNNMQQEN